MINVPAGVTVALIPRRVADLLKRLLKPIDFSTVTVNELELRFILFIVDHFDSSLNSEPFRLKKDFPRTLLFHFHFKNSKRIRGERNFKGIFFERNFQEFWTYSQR
jgi:hypothetical protein